MVRINTEVENTVVEIDGKEYPLALRTVEVADKLFEIEAAYRNKPAYRMWLEELRVLMGDAAVNELFYSGKGENLDRVQMIYSGVARAFNHTADMIEGNQRETQIQAVATALAPINELLRQVKALDRK